MHDVRLLISEHLDIEARFVTSETHFIYDLGADFLDRIELMIAIEDRFDVEITDDDIEQFRVVGDLIFTLPRRSSWATPSHFHSKQTIDDGRSETSICLNAGISDLTSFAGES